jgi:hypothetical protein
MLETTSWTPLDPAEEEEVQTSELQVEVNGFKVKLVGRHALVGCFIAAVLYACTFL